MRCFSESLLLCVFWAVSSEKLLLIFHIRLFQMLNEIGGVQRNLTSSKCMSDTYADYLMLPFGAFTAQPSLGTTMWIGDSDQRCLSTINTGLDWSYQGQDKIYRVPLLFAVLWNSQPFLFGNFCNFQNIFKTTTLWVVIGLYNYRYEFTLRAEC